MKKILIPILGISIGLVFYFMSNSPSEMEKSFDGTFTLTPAESALLSFDRFAELKPSQKEKKETLSLLKDLDLYNKNNSLALFIGKEKVEKVKAFISENQDKLLLEGDSEFIWKSGSNESLLFVKDESKSIQISDLVLNVIKADSTIEVQFAPNAKRVLSGFSMKYLNRPILLEINGELITTVKSFGKLENGILKIKITK